MGIKTNKGGVKHHKTDPKVVDVYQTSSLEMCHVHIFAEVLISQEVHTCHCYLKIRFVWLCICNLRHFIMVGADV